jgi:hypothetical protein
MGQYSKYSLSNDLIRILNVQNGIAKHVTQNAIQNAN